MNALTPVRNLRVVEDATISGDLVAVLGRDIRTTAERISRYCVTVHEPVYEDLATLVEGMAFLDRSVPRRRSGGWVRKLSVQVPVYEHGQFRRSVVIQALSEAARFLTGDHWNFEFVARSRPVPNRQGHLDLPRGIIRHVVPFSDGLDSFSQVQLSVREHGRESVMLVRSGLGADRIFPHLISLRVPRRFAGARMREVSYRTRPLIFYTMAAIAAVMTRAEAVVIGENGQGALGPACLPFADEWWFRSAHPAFVARWAEFLRIVLGEDVQFLQPQLWKTKGEVLTELKNANILSGWDRTTSCSTRPRERYGRWECGICGGCLLRAVSAHAAGQTLLAARAAFNVFGVKDIGISRDGCAVQMSRAERDVAVRALAAMEEFARLVGTPDGHAAVSREARLIEPDDPLLAEGKLHRLLCQHRLEWRNFLGALPASSWVREVVDQL